MPQLPAELTQRQAMACLRLLLEQQRAQRQSAVQIDASALTRFDSSALAVLLACRRAALTAGQHFSVQSMPAALAAMARLYGVHALLVEA